MLYTNKTLKVRQEQEPHHYLINCMKNKTYHDKLISDSIDDDKKRNNKSFLYKTRSSVLLNTFLMAKQI